jgi:alpha-tubulin suppressor-like RCC1 family protein
MYMFGSTENGRLGLGDDLKKELASYHPQLVRSLKQVGNISVVDCGDNHSAAIVHGKLYTWGMGSWGRLGLGTQVDVLVPRMVEIKGETPKDVVCGAYHTLTITAHHKLFAFGWNKNGRLGIGTEEKSLTIMIPREVKFDSGVKIVSVGAGQNISLALDDKGLLYSWGSGVFGNLGHGDEKDSFEPKVISVLKDKKVAHFAIGGQHALAVTGDGELYSWGLNKDRQLGRDDDKTNLFLPAKVSFDGKDTSHIAAGKSHSTLVKGGLLYTWGKGTSGALGHGDEKTVDVPTLVDSLKHLKIDQVACGWNHTCVLTDKGEVFVFGGREHGKLGIP